MTSVRESEAREGDEKADELEEAEEKMDEDGRGASRRRFNVDRPGAMID